MPLSCIIYDLDGTLIDSASDITIAINLVRHHYGLEALSELEIRAFVGDGAEKLVCRAIFGQVDDPATRPAQRLPKSAASAEELVTRFRDIYAADPVIETTVAKGAEKILAHWQGLGVAQVCLTNKPHTIAIAVLEQLGLATFFDLIVGAGAKDDDDEVLPPKPSAAVIDFILDQTGASLEETIIVGDGIADIEVAKNSGIMCIPILDGYTSSEAILAAATDLDLVSTSFRHAGELLLKINQSI